MKKFSRVLVAITAVFSLSLAAQPALAASTNEDIENTTAILADSIEKYNTDFDLAEDDAEVAAVTEIFQDEASSAIDKFMAAANSTGDDELKKYATNFSALTSKLIAAVSDMNQAVADSDQAAYAAAVNEYNKVIDDYNAEVDGYNQYIKDNPLASGDTVYALWFILLGISVVCLIVAIIIFVAGRNQYGRIPGSEDGKKKPVELKDVRRNVLIGAVLFVVGAAIPAVQYYIAVHNAESGGEFTYYILWELLAVGAILFVAGVVQYLITYTKLKKSGDLKHADDATAIALEKVNEEHKD